MKVTGLDGRAYTLDLRGKTNCTGQDCSGPHLAARELLREVFTWTPIAEEVYVPDCGLYLDFFLPAYRLVVEVDGEQHRQFIAFFHKHITGYARSSLRDNQKQQWCSLNEFSLLRLDDSQSDQWRAQVLAWRPSPR